MKLLRTEDIDEILQRVHDSGGAIKVDGWESKLFGKKLPEDLLSILKEYKLPIIYSIINRTEEKCYVCRGVGTKAYGSRVYCSDHTPTSQLRKRLIQLTEEIEDFHRKAEGLDEDSKEYKKIYSMYSIACQDLDEADMRRRIEEGKTIPEAIEKIETVTDRSY